ncbi:RagB/SusD family nutrient uptake outer membrane protein [Aquimarina sediminis]|uniref:RagB/SusD family nutrient uptake outer membrane protein n=1 Tax=Aquimarina sediminis TaxID=2070536 RepID=UPI000CA06150|nr:RagB/SusD family nutrient uptake outer membrane protein [Aquimarina sediminis]
MKKVIYHILVAGVLFTLDGCTSDFQDTNLDPHGISDQSLEQMNNHIRGAFSSLFLNVFRIVTEYQLQQNLNGDLYSGYMATPVPFRGGINNTTYALVDGWNRKVWEYAYLNVMPSSRKIKNTVELSQDSSNGKFVHLANIIKVLAMQRVSDIYGPIRYTKYDDPETTAEYDSQEVVYKAFFSDLNQAVDELKKYESDESFTPFDMSLANGDISVWRKFANSLRLRLAIRVVKVDPVLAKKQAELALSCDAGFLESSFIINTGYDHPLNVISDTWGDIRMGAVMESILEGFNDARIHTYFLPAEDPLLEGVYKGLRTGIELEAKAKYLGHSAIGSVVDGQDVVWFTKAEVDFLKAEAALRGWFGVLGTPKENYEEGIRASFVQHGIPVGGYLTDNTSTPRDYKDILNPSNNISYPSKLKIAYDESGTKEAQLEQIITQKWIAMFPDGMEAWSEYRRTGYPQVFPVVINNSGGLIDTNIQIRRFNFPDTEVNVNTENVKKAIGYLKGPDNGGTRLWWDIHGGNF